VLFFGHGKNCKLHKIRPGSFFTQLNHFIKTKLQEFKSILLIRHKQITHSAHTFTRSLSLNYRPTQWAELMQSIFSCHIAGHISRRWRNLGGHLITAITTCCSRGG
jgi:hypothetical protein